MSDVAWTSCSHGESKYSANNKSSKYKLFESSGNAGSFEAKNMCYSSEVLDDEGGNYSVMDTIVTDCARGVTALYKRCACRWL